MRCQACGVQAETRYVEFHQNIGVLVLRFSKAVKGDLCKSCIHRYFWELTGICLLLGWWGIISFFLNIIFIMNNVIRYLSCLGMAAPGEGGQAKEAAYSYTSARSAVGSSCPYCGRVDPELKHRGYCMACNKDV